ncbi:MAG TPA: hypothetical protein VFJ85_01775 [Acidimicrobiales bacterium]|nr:hypothetical protein [Acidimicrobiales bacterium]
MGRDRWHDPREPRHRWFLWLLVLLAAVVVGDQLGLFSHDRRNGTTRVLSEVVTTSSVPPEPVATVAPAAPAATVAPATAPPTTRPRVTTTTTTRPATTTTRRLATTTTAPTTTTEDTVKPYEWDTTTVP